MSYGSVLLPSRPYKNAISLYHHHLNRSHTSSLNDLCLNGLNGVECEANKGIDITRQDTNDEEIKPMNIKENDINE